jgi:Cytochrome C'
MRAWKLFLACFVWTACCGVAGFSRPQPPARTPAGRAIAAGTQTSQPRVIANLLQLMRGTLFPASNVIFSAQEQNPAKVPPAKDPSTATDPLANTYGQWQAVENAALAIGETANLLIIPGRKCSSGIDVPLKNPDWAKFVQELRDAALTAYKAAQSKDQDKITDASGTLSDACSNCHNKYREKPNLADRCK